MKKIIMLLATTLISTSCLANVPANSNETAGFQKHSAQLTALGATWNNAKSIHAKQDKNDITMVYTGEDVSLKSIVNARLITA